MTIKQLRQLFFDYWWIAGLAIVLIGAALYMTDCGSTWSFNRGVKKDKEAIANKVDEIKTIESQISELEQQKAEKTGELERDVEEYQRNVFGRDEAKAETNRALANFNAAVNSNSNVDRTAEDLKRILEKLDQQ